MAEAVESLDKYRYTGSKKFNIKKFDTADHGDYPSRKEAVDEFVNNLKEINSLQQKLYAERKEGVIFVFQAMDAAGKDGVIRTVFNTLSPHGVKEFCFKVPSSEESSHDYLWRFWSALPPRGSISIFNRSYYEDVLVGKVHELYKNQTRPDRLADVDIIRQRYSQIKDYEKYLFNTGTRVVKIFLNVSKDEQARRFISRIDTPKKNWKVSSGDIKEREYWDSYMEAFEKMVNTTSTKDSPWYVVPADHKWYCRLIVSRIVLETLKDMDPQYPVIDESDFSDAMAFREKLQASLTSEHNDECDAPSEFSKTGDIAADIVYSEEQEKIAADAGSEDAPEAEEIPADDDTSDLLAKAYEVFGLRPTIKLSKKEKAFLLAVNDMETDGELSDFYSLCDELDIRPSKLDKLVEKCTAKGFLEITDDGNVVLTDFGDRCLFRNKDTESSDKEFRDFLQTLNAEELEDFMSLCEEDDENSDVNPEDEADISVEIVEEPDEEAEK